MGTNRDITRLPGHVVFVLKVAVPGLDSGRGCSTQPGFVANDYIAIVPVRAVGVMAAWAVPLEFSARK